MAVEDDKEARIQLRRSRISARCNGGTPDEGATSSGKGAKYSNDEQVASSLARLDEIQADSVDAVTEIRVRTDRREAERRGVQEEDDAKRAEFLKRADDARDDDEVARGWERCLAATNVHDICSLLDRQKATCEAALTRLERVGDELGSELREKEHEYVLAIKRNRREVERLQERIAGEHRRLKDAFGRELEQIEASLLADRTRNLEANKEELEALISERTAAETRDLERQRRVIDEHRNEVSDHEAQAEREREGLKTTLEAEVRRLELELEDARARHRFDADKLDYDVRVLTELADHEDAAKKQKRRIMKGKEELTREVEDKHQAKTKGMRENELLEDDCDRIEKQSSGLKEKFERFKISDDEKYRSVLSMHQEDLRKLQGELKQSQDFIFGGAIGCVESAEKSCTSDLTLPGDLKSNKTNDGDEFELFEPENKNDLSKCDEWKQAEALMSDYRTILERRESLNAESALMQRQNEQLQQDLKKHLDEKVNEELRFPPSGMISAGGEGAESPCTRTNIDQSLKCAS